MTTRKLVLRAETLPELSTGELTAVVAAGTLWGCADVPTMQCTGDYVTRTCW